MWSSRIPNDDPAGGRPVDDVADTGVADIGPEPMARSTSNAPVRPPLQRGNLPQPSAVPPPPSQPPPAPGGGGGGGNGALQQQPLDSLSLAQVRRIVSDFPNREPVAYDFVYADMGPLEEEVDEWFVYQLGQWVRLDSVQREFESQWEECAGEGVAWRDADPDTRDTFVARALQAVVGGDPKDRPSAISVILYIVLGRWADTARSPSAGARRDSKIKSVATVGQLESMKAGVELLARLGGIAVLWEALTKAFEPFW